MGRPLKIKHSATIDIGFPVFGSLTAPVTPDSADVFAPTDWINVVGGDTVLADQFNPVITVRSKIAGQAEANAFIVRQKGSKKYLVTDTNVQSGVCILEDSNNGAITDGGMTITITLPGSSQVRLARMTNRWGIDFSGVRYLLNFFDTSSATAIKSGTAQVTVDMVKVNNPIF